MWFEVYQTVGATGGIVGLILVMGMMSWQGRIITALAGLVCIAAALGLNVNPDVKRAEASLTSRVVADPACTTVDVTAAGDRVDKWLVACPKQPGRPL